MAMDYRPLKSRAFKRVWAAAAVAMDLHMLKSRAFNKYPVL